MSREEAVSMIEDFVNKLSIDLKKADLEKTREIIKKDTVIATILNETMELVKKDNLVLVPVTLQLVQASWRIILERYVSADDSIHLLSALVTLSEIFVAADGCLIRRAKEEEFDSYDVEDYDVEEKEDCKKLEETLEL